ncbi:hypothetical protein IFM89_030728 [Coptis chinensis]|uniref:Nudix hydrolase domain-containing protein n=1 Tax=Coptis chinensis TaxID=261450 RepID=A0A835IVS7_9MAGN|nr:hypothetical protein IFM89_030728 [Coptis chinensis]
MEIVGASATSLSTPSSSILFFRSHSPYPSSPLRSKQVCTTKEVAPGAAASLHVYAFYLVLSSAVTLRWTEKKEESVKSFDVRCSITNDSSGVAMPGVGVVVLVMKGKKILLGKRHTSTSNATFGLPGGRLEFGESFEECGVREVKEESGLDIEKTEFVMVTNNLFLEDPNPTHYIAIILRAVLIDPSQEPENLESHMCDGWGWYDWNNLPNPLFKPLQTMLQSGVSPFPDDEK